MKVTFPHMGSSYIPIKALLSALGADTIVPPPDGRKTLALAEPHAPDGICLPYKMILGSLIYGLDQGADTVLFGGSGGFCRQEYFGDMLCDTLRSLGYTFRYVHIHLSDLWCGQNYEQARKLLGNIPLPRLAAALAEAVRLLLLAESLQTRADRVRCREAVPGTANRIIDRLTDRLLQAPDVPHMRHAMQTARHDLSNVKLRTPDAPLRVALVGEIYVASERCANLDLIRKLGALGVEVDNTLGAGMWVQEHLTYKLLPFLRRDIAVELASEYFGVSDFGGHGVQTVGNTLLKHKKGIDGVIQIYPLNCMPEVAAQSALCDIRTRYGVPILTLIVDEMTGEAGFVTRLEAFVDMLRLRKYGRIIG